MAAREGRRRSRALACRGRYGEGEEAGGEEGGGGDEGKKAAEAKSAGEEGRCEGGAKGRRPRRRSAPAKEAAAKAKPPPKAAAKAKPPARRRAAKAKAPAPAKKAAAEEEESGAVASSGTMPETKAAVVEQRAAGARAAGEPRRADVADGRAAVAARSLGRSAASQVAAARAHGAADTAPTHTPQAQRRKHARRSTRAAADSPSSRAAGAPTQDPTWGTVPAQAGAHVVGVRRFLGERAGAAERASAVARRRAPHAAAASTAATAQPHQPQQRGAAAAAAASAGSRASPAAKGAVAVAVAVVAAAGATSRSGPTASRSQLDPLLRRLRRQFNLRDFRPGQEQVIRDLLAGKDVLAIMPTGAGKSLTYQLTAFELPGVTVVVSPLLALMSDQLQKLRRTGAVGARLDSTEGVKAKRETLERIDEGKHKIIYVTPERAASGALVKELGGQKVALFVVDEAHCVSEWGHDFRPAYLALRTVKESLPSAYPDRRPPVLALTATATPQGRRGHPEAARSQGARHGPHRASIARR